MIEANLGAVNPDLVLGARNAVETCLGIRPGEKVVLIADEPSREVAASLAHALALQQAAWTGCLIEDIAARPLSGAPDEVLEALEAADVGILCMKPLPGELPARMAIVSIVERRQIRYADRKSTRLNSSHGSISYAVFCLKKKKTED